MAKREEWIVMVVQNWDKDDPHPWRNAKMWYPGVQSLSDRYCSTEAEARNVLEYALKKWNGKKQYGKDGKRYETTEAAPGICVTVVIDPQTDDDMQIIKYMIRKRIVTDWETVEKG